MTRKTERPKGLADAIPSYQWREREDYKKENRDWLKNSRRVALRVLDVLDEKGMTQQTLADLLKVSRQQVSKIVKGQENFTFETIAKLENALGVILMDIFDGKERKVETGRNIQDEPSESVAKEDSRISKKQRDYFERVLEVAGFRSITDFLISAASEKVEAIIEKSNNWLASENDRKVFFHALLSPPVPNKKLKDAMKKHRKIKGKK